MIASACLSYKKLFNLRIHQYPIIYINQELLQRKNKHLQLELVQYENNYFTFYCVKNVKLATYLHASPPLTLMRCMQQWNKEKS